MDKPWQCLFEKIIIMYFFLFKAKQIFLNGYSSGVFLSKIYWAFRKWVSLEFCNTANFIPRTPLCIYILLFFILTILVTINIKEVYISLFLKKFLLYSIPDTVLPCPYKYLR